jgi:hypothetical protein
MSDTLLSELPTVCLSFFQQHQDVTIVINIVLMMYLSHEDLCYAFPESKP